MKRAQQQTLQKMLPDRRSENQDTKTMMQKHNTFLTGNKQAIASEAKPKTTNRMESKSHKPTIDYYHEH